MCATAAQANRKKRGSYEPENVKRETIGVVDFDVFPERFSSYFLSE